MSRSAGLDALEAATYPVFAMESVARTPSPVAMEYVGRTPSPPLDTFIERLWYCAAPSPIARERVLPGGGTMDLVINLFEDDIRIYDAANPASVRAHAGSLVGGAQTRCFFADPRQRASVMGAHFKPGGAFPFFGISAAEITDAHVSLQDLWTTEGRCLREQLVEARSASDRLRLLEAALLRKLRSARAGHPAVRAAMSAFRSGGNDVRVGDVATLVGLSRRRFIEVFETEVGLTPKLYARLQRFHRVKRAIARLDAAPSWATFALESGYFDQSHMIRDFVEFSGISPTAYLRSRTGETLFDHMVHAYPDPSASPERREVGGRDDPRLYRDGRRYST